MSEEVKEESLGFGCANCWPADADLAATGIRNTKPRVRLADESHFMLARRACDTCAQRFLFCFTESIDWAGGDDAQYVTYLPLRSSSHRRWSFWMDSSVPLDPKPLAFVAVACKLIIPRESRSG
jgi:hypothetical protein